MSVTVSPPHPLLPYNIQIPHNKLIEIIKLSHSPQIPGLTLLIRTKSSLFMQKVNGFWGWICRQVLVDEVHFPPISHRFTAVYSRDKEYLYDELICYNIASLINI